MYRQWMETKNNAEGVKKKAKSMFCLETLFELMRTELS